MSAGSTLHHTGLPAPLPACSTLVRLAATESQQTHVRVLMTLEPQADMTVKQHECSPVHVSCLHVLIHQQTVCNDSEYSDTLQQDIHCHTLMLQHMCQGVQNSTTRHICRRFPKQKYTSCKVCIHNHLLPRYGIELSMQITDAICHCSL